MIAALPEEVTADNADGVRAQLDQILALFSELTGAQGWPSLGAMKPQSSVCAGWCLQRAGSGSAANAQAGQRFRHRARAALSPQQRISVMGNKKTPSTGVIQA